jgi:hypothetical protein
MRFVMVVLFSSVLLTGCAISPIPKNVATMHVQSRADFDALRPHVQVGDVIFRLGATKVAGGLLDFSKTVASMSDSDFSHACVVLQADDIMVADITMYGIERRFFRDWYISGTENVVVKRLRPEYRDLIPKVMGTLDELIDQDVLYNVEFSDNGNKFYCTEVVDHIFRVNGAPLADRMRIRDMPHYNVFVAFCCLVGGIDADQEIVVAGNEEIGLFSSPMLETVVDLRDGHAGPAAVAKLAQVASP